MLSVDWIIDHVLPVIFRVLLFVAAIALRAPWWIIERCWRAQYLLGVLRRIRLATQDTLMCPMCHRVQSALQAWRCPVCRGVARTHCWSPCHICGTEIPAGYV